MQAARKVVYFVDDQLSNWYVRLSRRRLWKGEYAADKISAYQTLYECLETVAKLMAPIAPFFGDWLYKNLNDVTGKDGAESVHLALMPETKEDWIDPALEQRMDYAKRISSLVLSLRKREQIRFRQPLQKIILPVLNAEFEKQVRAVENLRSEEVNVKSIEYFQVTECIIKKNKRLDYKSLDLSMVKQINEGASVSL